MTAPARVRLDWLRAPGWGWTALGRHRWTVRGPLMGKPMFWLYRDGNRVNETGSYADSLHFTTKAAAMRYAETKEAR